MPDSHSVNELISMDREIRTHWIWDRELPNENQIDQKGRCLICELVHPATAAQWARCKQSGESKMIEERHDGYEFVSHQNHGDVSKKL